MVGIFKEASQSLKAFSPPRNISSEPTIEEFLDDPLNFSQDIQPTTFTVVQRAVDVEANAATKPGPSAEHTDSGPTPEGIWLLNSTML